MAQITKQNWSLGSDADEDNSEQEGLNDTAEEGFDSAEDDNSEVETSKVTLVSFGYANGPLKKATITFSVRHFPNPSRQLRSAMDGRNARLAKHMFDQPEAELLFQELSTKVTDFVATRTRPDANIIIGVGCEEGKHRSVAVVERMAHVLRDIYRNEVNIVVVHRDLDRKLRKKAAAKANADRRMLKSAFADDE
jgi:RNase adaptor protein for sRNA GlmZ degradation